MLTESQAFIKAVRSHQLNCRLELNIHKFDLLGFYNEISILWAPEHIGLEGEADETASKKGPDPFYETGRDLHLWYSLKKKYALGNYMQNETVQDINAEI